MPTLTATAIPVDTPLDVVGESHYQPALKRALARGREHPVLLVAEEGNPYDSDAIRVDLLLDGKLNTVGYLHAETAEALRPALDKLTRAKKIAAGTGVLLGGDPGRPSVGVVVELRYTPGAQPINPRYLVRSQGGKKTNHPLHLILTLCTGGLWLFVWIPVARANARK